MPLNLIFVQPGTYYIEDDGVPGNNTSVIKDSNGNVIFTFAHPADALGFTVSTPGVNIVVNFTDSMGAANFTIGNLADAAASPDSIVMQNIVTTGTVTLVANGSVSEGSDVDSASDITAGALAISAVSGIGTAGNALETRTGLFEAETTTGGINISNIGSVQIGGVVAEVDGLDVATSGDISFVSFGSIFLTEANSVTAGEVVHGGGTSGNVALTANGANADIIGNVDNGAASVPRGSLTMTAGRDIQLGTIGADFNNDVIANNAVTFTAGRDILIDGFADILADNFGLNTGADLTFTAGRNIGILNVAGTSASVTASGSAGGDAYITTGFGGALTVNGPGSFALGSTSGNVVIQADRMLIDAGSGISAPSGQVLLTTRTDGRSILLGSGTDAATALELSSTELTRIFSPTLTIGADTGGQVRVIGAVTMNAGGNAANVSLLSSTSILLQANLTVLDALTLRSRDDLFQSAASTVTANTLTALVDNLNDDSGGNTGTFSGNFTVTSHTIQGNTEGDTLSGTAQANLIFGLAGNDTLRGNGGNDSLDGGSGNDTMIGGLGDDIFYADVFSDVVTEAVGEGNDRVQALNSYSLTAGASIEILESTNISGTAAQNLSGNEFGQTITGNNGVNILEGFDGNDTLNGNGGADYLSGGIGNDTMDGGSGDDVYFVDSALDVVNEVAGFGNDRIATSVTFTLNGGTSIETLETVSIGDTTAINLTGNAFGQTIIGNDGVNILAGGGGSDVLIAAGGDDFLVGNAAAATQMQGGTGNDTFYIYHLSDVVDEASGNGSDRVVSTITYALTAGAHVELMELADPAAVTTLHLTGNDLAQTLVGNAGNNVLNGRGGNDVLQGLGGDDDYNFTTALGAGNVDQIVGFATGADDIVLENAIFTALAAGALPAGAFVVGPAAADADDRIIYNSSLGALLYDADGNGAGAAVQFASLAGAPILQATDFVVI